MSEVAIEGIAHTAKLEAMLDILRESPEPLDPWWPELDLAMRRLNAKYPRESMPLEIQRNLAIMSLTRAARALK